MAEITLTAENFETEVLHSTIPVMIDFWASWCGPCRMLAPIVAEFADEHDGEVKVCKVNVDEQPELAAQYNISSIPTILIFKNGVLTNTAIGYQPKAKLETLI